MIIMAFLWFPMTTGPCSLPFPTPQLTGSVWECLLKAEPFPQSEFQGSQQCPWDAGPLGWSPPSLDSSHSGPQPRLSALLSWNRV